MQTVSLVVCLGQFSSRAVEGSRVGCLACCHGVIGTILGRAIISSLENTEFCSIAGGSNAIFESLCCAGTGEVVGVGGVRAIPSSPVTAAPSPMATSTFRKRFNPLGSTQRQRKMAFTVENARFPKQIILEVRPRRLKTTNKQMQVLKGSKRMTKRPL